MIVQGLKELDVFSGEKYLVFTNLLYNSDFKDYVIVRTSCVLSPSIFSVILIYPSRISSVRRVGSSGFFSLDEPRNDPIGFAGYQISYNW